MTNTELKNNIDTAITNKTSVSSITPSNVGEQIKSTVDYVDQEISNIKLIPGPAGPQGIQGIQGDPGVGASQTLQETVDLGNTVIANTNFKFGIFDSVSGVSVENTSTQSKTTLETSKLTFTKNSFGLKTTNLFQAITPLVNRAIYLPDADGTLAIERAKVSKQINVTTGEPEINAIDYVRIFANDEYQSCKLTGPHTVGKEIYIKNTTAFNVVINGIVENINGNSSLTLPPNTYWRLIKEDGGTNSITAFKLSLT